MSEIIVHGIAGSPFVRAVLAGLEEKGAAWRLSPLIPGEFRTPAYLAKHPFGRMPVIENGGYVLYETQAILRYLDALIPSPPLQPKAPQAVGRMNQLIGINDWYFFPQVAAVIGFERVVKPMFLGQEPDLDRVAAAVPQARVSFDELERLLDDQAFLAGDALTIADLMLAPQIAFLAQTPEGAELLAGKRLAGWLARMEARPSFQATRTERLLQAA
ncbi:MAG: glutathione S-transferase family protein [Phenylobacterium sp.]